MPRPRNFSFHSSSPKPLANLSPQSLDGKLVYTSKSFIYKAELLRPIDDQIQVGDTRPSPSGAPYNSEGLQYTITHLTIRQHSQLVGVCQLRPTYSYLPGRFDPLKYHASREITCHWLRRGNSAQLQWIKC
jgi:hypothetical protein